MKRKATFNDAVRVIEKLQDAVVFAAMDLQVRTCTCRSIAAGQHSKTCGGKRNASSYFRASRKAQAFLEQLEPKIATERRGVFLVGRKT